MNAVEKAEALIQQGGRVHLMGIGGIGMAGVAWLLHERGFSVSGCDLLKNRQTSWLEASGIDISIGHAESHVENIDWLIRSTAVPDIHPEVEAALRRGTPVSRRGEVLPALMRDRLCIAVSGTHGKTTTTSMIAQLLDCGFCVGGEVAGSAAVAKDAEIMVVEADESDGTVAGYTPDYSVITNIEYDHMEHHESEDAFVACFERLIEQTQKTVYYASGDRIAAKICGNHPKCEPFNLPDVEYELPLPGVHNQWNAAAATMVCRLWLAEDELRARLQQVQPVARRFERVYDDCGILVVSDYAHHPTEIAAVIQTAEGLKPKRLLALFQPHRYTRTQALGSDFPPSFEGLDRLWLLPVYAASEQPIPGGRSSDLFGRFDSQWKDRLLLVECMKVAWLEVSSQLKKGDILLILGAGDIEQVADWAREWYPGEGSNLLPTD